MGAAGLTSPDYEFTLRALTQSELVSVTQHAIRNISLIKPGDFAWLWYKRTTVEAVIVEEMLVKCIGSSGGIVVLQTYLTDRKAAMSRSALEQEIDLFVITLPFNSDNDDIQPILTGRGSFETHNMQFLSVFSMGSDLVGWIQTYILSHEGVFGSLSSCFLYHAAIAMPRALIYATELVCHLMGAKPIVLVQFTSQSDSQYKLPFVQEISRNIIAAIDSKVVTNLAYRIHEYKGDKTLVFYRTNREYLVELLRPNRQAQALHIAPYANTDDLSELKMAYREQIYNSWWNGYILGYPEHFIDSYCLEFHNEVIRKKDKLEEVDQATADVKAYFLHHQLDPVSIGLGLDEDMLSSIYPLPRS